MENPLTINGQMFKEMMISGANAINAQKSAVNELNVFPVPDGDTGTNMSMTMSAARRELMKLGPCTAGEAANAAASALIRGARGNSGVILSLLFRGIARGLSDCAIATGENFIDALLSGVDSAYKAVMKPQEGTILTVAREAAEACVRLRGERRNDVGAVLETALSAAQETLAKTPEMLPVLKKAGVVDAGGKGFVIIFGAMLSAFRGSVVESGEEGQESVRVPVGGAAGDSEEEIHFTYCTEFIINKEPGSQKDPLALRAFLGSIGDCVLVADDANIIKVHVHTNNPDQALREALTYGSLTDLKIDNMRVQHEANAAVQTQLHQDAVPEDEAPAVPAQPEKPVGFVAVAAGKGVVSLFGELGADRVVQGGQTMNPSTEDILKAIESTPAETVIVLPNNKNIIMAAEQAVALAGRKTFVLHTKTIPQGIAAMLAYDAETPVDRNLVAMQAAAEQVQTGLVTFAARDSEFDGRKIKKDEILALANGKLSFTESDPVRAAVRLAKSLSRKTTSYVTLISGADVDAAAAEEARRQIAEKFGEQVEVTLIDGGQPVYHFILSVE